MGNGLVRDNRTTVSGEAKHALAPSSGNVRAASLLIGIVAAQGVALLAQSTGSLSVAPTRVVFEDRAFKPRGLGRSWCCTANSRPPSESRSSSRWI